MHQVEYMYIRSGEQKKKEQECDDVEDLPMWASAIHNTWARNTPCMPLHSIYRFSYIVFSFDVPFRLQMNHLIHDCGVAVFAVAVPASAYVMLREPALAVRIGYFTKQQVRFNYQLIYSQFSHYHRSTSRGSNWYKVHFIYWARLAS